MAQPVFISHSSVDKETADQVCEAIEERGVNCWIAPRNVPPGARYGEAILQALEDCSAMVLVVSEHSNASEQVMNEIERAVSKRKEVFPLKIDAVTPSPELEFFIARRHWLDATSAPLNDLLDQLASAIQNMLSAVVDAAPSGTSAASPPRVQQAPRQASRSTQAKRGGGKKGMSIAAGVLMLVLIAAALAYMTRRRSAVPALSELPTAYAALKQGDWSKAKSLFQQLQDQSHPQTQGQGYAGLAAVASDRDDNDPALLLATEAERVDPDIVYSHVIRGNVMWKREKLSEAEMSYRTALDKSNGTSWQKAEAANRLGRIYAFQGQTKKAIDQYDIAIELDPTMAAVHANKGHLQAQRDLYQDAIDLYQQALQVDPEDKVATALLRVAERQKAFKQDRDRFRRMQNEVRELMGKFQSGKENPTSELAWVSTPLTLLLLPLQRQGSLAIRAGEEEFLQYSIEQALRDSGRVTSGLILEVLGSAESGDGNSADIQSMPVGQIRVDTVEAQQSKAAVLKQAQPFQKEWKVREVQQP